MGTFETVREIELMVANNSMPEQQFTMLATKALPASIEQARDQQLRNALMGLALKIIEKACTPDMKGAYAHLYADAYLRSVLRQSPDRLPGAGACNGLPNGWHTVLANRIITLIKTDRCIPQVKNALATLGEQVVGPLPERAREGYLAIFTLFNHSAYSDESRPISAVLSIGKILREYRKDGTGFGQGILAGMKDALAYAAISRAPFLRTYASGYLERNRGLLVSDADQSNISGVIPNQFIFQINDALAALQQGDTKAIAQAEGLLQRMTKRELRETAAAVATGIEANMFGGRKNYTRMRLLAGFGSRLCDRLDECMQGVYEPLYALYAVLAEPISYPAPQEFISLHATQLSTAIRRSSGGQGIPASASHSVFNAFVRIIITVSNSPAAMKCIEALGCLDHPYARKALEGYANSSIASEAVREAAKDSLSLRQRREERETGVQSRPLPATFRPPVSDMPKPTAQRKTVALA